LETAGQKIYCVNMKDFLENRTAQWEYSLS
jgi:hypothetical protein